MSNCEAELFLALPSTDGKRTKREELEAYEFMSGEDEPALHFDPPPRELAHVIPIYNQLGAVDFKEFEAYQNVTGVRLARYEIDAIQAIENTRKRIVNG